VYHGIKFIKKNIDYNDYFKKKYCNDETTSLCDSIGNKFIQFDVVSIQLEQEKEKEKEKKRKKKKKKKKKKN
jgi:hypothetical protein